MVDIAIEGTIGTATATYDLFKAEIDSGKVEYDPGSWGKPVRLRNVEPKDAKAISDLLAEFGFSSWVERKH